LACAAGLLMAFDGLHLVLSRTALLDIFLLLFVLAGFGCVLLDREWRARRTSGPAVPWWLLGAGLCLGLATAVKWSGAWFLPVYGVLLLAGDASARRAAGVPAPWRHTVHGTGPWLLGGLALAAGAYLATWTGGFTSGGSLSGLLTRHREIWQFNTGLGDAATHPYASSPVQWLLLGRPVAFDFACAEPCGPTSRVSEVMLLGTPLLWWSFLPALLVLGWLAIARADRRAVALVLCALAGIVPWLRPGGGGLPTFLFDAAPAEPFLVLAVVYALSVLSRRFARPAIVVGAYVVVVAACFAYFYPVFVGSPLSHEDWLARMWLGDRWI
jgi:dolichyl-phosphate-mannose--protein O-mannosyl transferase